MQILVTNLDLIFTYNHHHHHHLGHNITGLVHHDSFMTLTQINVLFLTLFRNLKPNLQLIYIVQLIIPKWIQPGYLKFPVRCSTALELKMLKNN